MIAVFIRRLSLHCSHCHFPPFFRTRLEVPALVVEEEHVLVLDAGPLVDATKVAQLAAWINLLLPAERVHRHAIGDAEQLRRQETRGIEKAMRT